jgi:D-psicose/D-tagatose/L-ribulose 3-epimerase
MVKFGINMLLWTTQVGEEQFPALAEVKALGYDGVEFPLFAADDARYRRVRGELDRLGLEATAVAIATREANPISADVGVRDAAVESIQQAIRTTNLLGGRVLCGPLHSALAYFVGRRRTDEEWAWCVETLRRVGDYAERMDVTLAVEALNRFESYFLNTAEEMRRLIDEVAHPRIRAMYDTFHANLEERSIEAAVRTLMPVLAHVHVSENDRGVPGEGLVRWAETFAALKAGGYDGWLTIEAFGPSLPELSAMCIWRPLFDSERGLAQRGLRFMREQWALAPETG